MSDFEVFPTGTERRMRQVEVQLHDIRTVVLPIIRGSEQKLRDDLIALRVSVARIAQKVGVDNELCVTDADYADLVQRARQIDEGWNDLAGRVVESLILNGGQ